MISGDLRLAILEKRLVEFRRVQGLHLQKCRGLFRKPTAMKSLLSKERKATDRIMTEKEAGFAQPVQLKLFQDLTRFFLIIFENGKWLSTPSAASVWELWFETNVILKLRTKGHKNVRNVVKLDGLPMIVMLLLGCDLNVREYEERGLVTESRR